MQVIYYYAHTQKKIFFLLILPTYPTLVLMGREGETNIILFLALFWPSVVILKFNVEKRTSYSNVGM
jgi:hypothetical protein